MSERMSPGRIRCWTARLRSRPAWRHSRNRTSIRVWGLRRAGPLWKVSSPMVERKAPLSLLAELAQGRRDDAGRVLARSLALLKDSEARLAMLESYRNEYRRRYAANGKTGIAPHELRNFRDFLERLDKAIAQQRAEA